jgi:hypothetical protein
MRTAKGPKLTGNPDLDSALRMGYALNARRLTKRIHDNWHNTMRKAIVSVVEARHGGDIPPVWVDKLGIFDGYGWERSGGSPNLKDGLRYAEALAHEAVEVLTELEMRILEELAGHAMTAEALTIYLQKRAVERDVSTVKRAISHLTKMGEVANKKGLGYYRTDAPPKPVN